LGNHPIYDTKENDMDNNEDNTSSASYKHSKEKFESELIKKKYNLNRQIMNNDNEIVKNYGSFNSLNDINKLTDHMANYKANSNTNEIPLLRKANTLYKVTKNKQKIKKIIEKNKIEYSYTSSSLSSLESELYKYDMGNNNKIKKETEPSNKRLSTVKSKDKEKESIY